jgi:hypothetical protein
MINMPPVGAMSDDEIRRIYDEHRRLVQTHCWIGPVLPNGLPAKLVRSELVERYAYEMLTEAQIDWLIDNFTGRGEIGKIMVDLLYTSRHPKAEEWADSSEGDAILEDEGIEGQPLLTDLLGGRCDMRDDGWLA